MAKKKFGKKAKKKYKKKQKKLSSLQLKAKQKKLVAKRELAKGKKPKKYKRAKAKAKLVRKEIKKRQAKVFDISGGYNQTLKDIKASSEWGQLNQMQKDSYEEILNAFTPAELKKANISGVEKKLINKRVKEFGKLYGKRGKQLTKDHEEALRGDIDDLNRELQYANEDLQKALTEGNTYDAEKLKAYQRTLNDTMGELKTEYAAAAQEKKDYLDNQLKNMQQTLERRLGETTEAEMAELRTLERDYTYKLDDLQNNMANQGLAFSGDRVVEEEYLGESTAELKATAQREAEFARQETEQEYGAEAQSWESRMAMDEIERLTREHGYSMSDAIQLAEEQFGTSGVSAIVSAEEQQYLVGGQTGELYKQQAEREYQAQTEYDRSTAEAGAGFEQEYGTDEFSQAFSSGYGSYQGTYDQETLPGRGSESDIPAYSGAATSAYEQALEENKQEKEAAQHELEQELLANKTI